MSEEKLPYNTHPGQFRHPCDLTPQERTFQNELRARLTAGQMPSHDPAGIQSPRLNEILHAAVNRAEQLQDIAQSLELFHNAYWGSGNVPTPLNAQTKQGNQPTAIPSSVLESLTEQFERIDLSIQRIQRVLSNL